MNEEMLKVIEEIRDTKDMDEIANLFVRISAMCGLSVAELAALNYYTMVRAFETPVNQEWFKKHMNLDVAKLSIEGTLKVQEALVNVYMKELMNDGGAMR